MATVGQPFLAIRPASLLECGGLAAALTALAPSPAFGIQASLRCGTSTSLATKGKLGANQRNRSVAAIPSDHTLQTAAAVLATGSREQIDQFI
jgi:hypothetical protein